MIKENETFKKKDPDNIVSIIKTKCQYLITKYFGNDSKIDEYLKIGKCIICPKIFLKQLCYSSTLLKNESVSDSDLIQIFNILIDNSKNMTFYEIEKSSILLNLCCYIDETYMHNFEKSINKSSKISINPGKKFLERVSKIFSILSNKINSINELLNILQNCISSMNCFKLFISDNDNLCLSGSYSLSIQYLTIALQKNKSNNLKFKINFQYNINQGITKN